MFTHRLFLRFVSFFGAHHVPQRDMHERDRARQRIGIAGAYSLVVGWQAWQREANQALDLLLPVICLAYALYAAFHLKVVLARAHGGEGSQYLFIVLDSVLTITCLVGAPAVLAPIYPLLMVQIVRCGMRYGMRTMWLAWGSAALTALLLMPLSYFWSNDRQMLWSFIVMMAITPPLMGPLVRRLNEVTEELRQAAGADPLTGLGNRRTLADRTKQAQERSARDQTLVALVLFDLDNFKKVNDTLGHVVGDRLLEQVATSIRRGCRSTDFIARVGGDEFVLLLEGLPVNTGQSKALEIANKIVGIIEHTAQCIAPGIPVSASAGMYCWQHDARQPSTETELIARADEAMYAAKRAGKARVVLAAA